MVALLRVGVNRQQQRTIDADGVHRADTISSPLADGDPMQVTNPGAAWMIALVGMHLGIDKSAGWVPSGRSEGILVTVSLARLRDHSPGH
jgi:hypothetical protein